MTTELSVQLLDKNTTLDTIDNLITTLLAAEFKLEMGWTRVGHLLTEVSEQKLWVGEFHSFDAYIRNLEQRHGKGRTSLYSYFGTVRDLKDHVSAELLPQIGLGKAQELVRAIKSTGVGPTPEILEQAVKSTCSVKDVRKLLYDAKQVGADEEGSEWLDLDFSGMVTPDQKAVILAAIKAADHTDPVIPTTWKQPARQIERLTRFAMEFLNAHAEEE